MEYTDGLCGVHSLFMWSTLRIYMEYSEDLFNDTLNVSDPIA